MFEGITECLITQCQPWNVYQVKHLKSGEERLKQAASKTPRRVRSHSNDYTSVNLRARRGPFSLLRLIWENGSKLAAKLECCLFHIQGPSEPVIAPLLFSLLLSRPAVLQALQPRLWKANQPCIRQCPGGFYLLPQVNHWSTFPTSSNHSSKDLQAPSPYSNIVVLVSLVQTSILKVCLQTNGAVFWQLQPDHWPQLAGSKREVSLLMASWQLALMPGHPHLERWLA